MPPFAKYTAFISVIEFDEKHTVQYEALAGIYVREF